MSALKELGKAGVGLPAEVEGGNPGKFSGESPEGLAVRQDDPLNAKDQTYNRLWREMEWRLSDRRMRSPSVDVWDNITQSERGPQGSG
ncbi:hypothetical protein ES703_62690 [subsurface metagenome]